MDIFYEFFTIYLSLLLTTSKLLVLLIAFSVIMVSMTAMMLGGIMLIYKLDGRISGHRGSEEGSA